MGLRKFSSSTLNSTNTNWQPFHPLSSFADSTVYFLLLSPPQCYQLLHLLSLTEPDPYAGEEGLVTCNTLSCSAVLPFCTDRHQSDCSIADYRIPGVGVSALEAIIHCACILQINKLLLGLDAKQWRTAKGCKSGVWARVHGSSKGWSSLVGYQ